MPHSKDDRNKTPNSLTGGLSSMFQPTQTPMLAILTEMSGSVIEAFATAQKDWMDFAHQRIKEDVAVSRQLMQCQSLPEWHEVYSQYLNKTMAQYKEQSSKVVRRGQAVAEHIAEAAENGKESARARH